MLVTHYFVIQLVSVFSVVFLYVQSVFIYLLTYEVNKLRYLKLYLLKGEKSSSAEMEIVFSELLLFGKEEISDEK